MVSPARRVLSALRLRDSATFRLLCVSLTSSSICKNAFFKPFPCTHPPQGLSLLSLHLAAFSEWRVCHGDKVGWLKDGCVPAHAIEIAISLSRCALLLPRTGASTCRTNASLYSYTEKTKTDYMLTCTYIEVMSVCVFSIPE